MSALLPHTSSVPGLVLRVLAHGRWVRACEIAPRVGAPVHVVGRALAQLQALGWPVECEARVWRLACPLACERARAALGPAPQPSGNGHAPDNAPVLFSLPALVREIEARHGLEVGAIIRRGGRGAVMLARRELAQTLLARGWTAAKVGRSFERDHTTVLYWLGRVHKGGTHGPRPDAPRPTFDGGGA